jgi:hypothetical protein
MAIANPAFRAALQYCGDLERDTRHVLERLAAAESGSGSAEAPAAVERLREGVATLHQAAAEA